MERHFQRELESLQTMLIKMGTLAEESVVKALRAVSDCNVELAQKVVEDDERVDMLEVEIDNAIIDLLALQQPVASDLRFIIAAQKINNDLERIGDHAVNIAQSVHTFAETASVNMMDVPEMSDVGKRMLHDALDSFIQHDPNRARRVLELDDKMDELNRVMGTKIVAMMKNDVAMLECGLDLLRVSKNLERIADLSTNIAEEVIFQAQARIIKHHADEPRH